MNFWRCLQSATEVQSKKTLLTSFDPNGTIQFYLLRKKVKFLFEISFGCFFSFLFLNCFYIPPIFLLLPY